jgi:vacuolar iron transporter family protein
MNNTAFKKGFGFGLTSSVITTLGLMVGVIYGTNSKTAVITSVLTIALADSFSDALGIHISEEASGTESAKSVWLSTVYTLIFKIGFTLTFLIPVLALPLQGALVASLIWGFFLLGIFSYAVGKKEGQNPFGVVLEHYLVAIMVLFLTYIMGNLISELF